jgi:hypothetical protein
MPKKHHDKRWVKLRKEVKPRLMARLPHPCPRCGGMMSKEQRLDLGHISRHGSLVYEASNVRLEHMSCNRRDGQRVTTALRTIRTPSKRDERMPKW